MNWSKEIFRVAGIPIKIHMTMLLLAAWMVFIGNNSTLEQITELINLFILFGSVGLHELGHALTAKKLGIRTRDITLYPFGGIASLIDKINPKQEFLITLAGPLVNIVIAFSILAIIGIEGIQEKTFIESTIGRLFTVNAALAIFNALPAFPMDGGRILRSALQIFGIKSATRIAVRVGQAICIIMAILAFIYSHPILLIISVFIFANASKELVLSDIKSKSNQMSAKEIMIHLENLQKLPPSLTLEMAAKLALRSLQAYFPIALDKRILGIVDRELILQKACSSIDHQYITEIMLRDLPCCDAKTSIYEIITIFEQNSSPALLVGNQDECEGIIFKEQLNDILLIDEMFKQNSAQRELERELGSP